MHVPRRPPLARLPGRSPMPGVIAAAALGLAACDRPRIPADTAAPEASSHDASISVLVVDEDGAPLADLWVALKPSGRESSTDADGLAVFGRLEAGTYEVVAAGEGIHRSSLTAEATAEGTQVELAVMLRHSGGAIMGTVSDPTLAPVSGAELWVDGALAGTSDSEGSFALEGIEEGPVTLEVTGPSDGTLLTWTASGLTMVAGQAARIDVILPDSPSDAATFVGSEACLECHADEHAAWTTSAHATALASPSDLSGSELASAFVQGEEQAVDLSQLVDGATAWLGATGPSDWYVRIEDASGATSGDLQVVGVYGGHSSGAALAAEVDDTWVVLPVAWSPGGPSSQHPAAGMVAAWPQGWFDAGDSLDLDGAGAPGPEASWDLRCGGCHATGYVLEQDAGHYSLGALGDDVERAVGCEACHGPGSEHGDNELAIFNPGLVAAVQNLEVCARCHERLDTSGHGFADEPGWVTDGDGLPALASTDDAGMAARSTWLAADISTEPGDQVGDFRASPHRTGQEGYDGACSDCHDVHGSGLGASLRFEATDNQLCTSCHAAALGTEEQQAEHAGHATFHPGRYSPGACTGCHLGRSATRVQADALSGTGELHAHLLTPVHPDAALAEFDAAGVETLPLGSFPVPVCVDCHLQANAIAEDAGYNAGAPMLDPTQRHTYEVFGAAWDETIVGADR